jgi:hypothetical protein
MESMSLVQERKVQKQLLHRQFPLRALIAAFATIAIATKVVQMQAMFVMKVDKVYSSKAGSVKSTWDGDHLVTSPSSVIPRLMVLL